MRFVAALLTLSLSACGGTTEDAPTCQQAMAHYYAAGCVLVNLQTGASYSQGEITANCLDLIARAPDQCLDDLADLRSCFGGVPSPVTSNADCDCSREQQAILTCE